MNKLTKLACLSLFLLFSASISSAAPKDYRYTTVHVSTHWTMD